MKLPGDINVGDYAAFLHDIFCSPNAPGSYFISLYLYYLFGHQVIIKNVLYSSHNIENWE